ncbi:receptor homology region, transmembrane domain- and RING domain-containing protein 1 isoform X2 [Ziziphus jujuba]|uniref:Receptor homology region, transmembrane domain- and RING domain-containing protein 1 isoform X2 n=1 Tax=Ziziphus jujuba TaxID=326968 RepID=A0A6P4AS63_ZIZJJ|nr:receptor homology region, transmembrane domain- and RING domain-containing protein 1 isoform X2 [Ziziphus jujuba]
MRKSVLAFLLVFSFNALLRLSSATVLFRPLSISFPDLPAKFAMGINGSGICGALLVAEPLDGCSPLRNDLRSNKTDGGWFALIARGHCAFEDKVRNAQNAGFRAAIVYDDREKGNLVYMMINRKNISVHAVFISKIAGEILKEHAHGKEGECCIFPFHNGTAWTVLAISCISFLFILAILTIAIFIPRYWLNSRGRNHVPKTVDSKMVEALPCFVFSSAHLSDLHAGETCAICLEDYKDGEILKVLPCQHEFHSSCVDSWLTKWGTFCPVCKRDMRTKTEYSEVKRRTWL